MQAWDAAVTVQIQGVPLPRGVVGPSEDTDPVANDIKKQGAKGSGPAWSELGMSLAAQPQ